MMKDIFKSKYISELPKTVTDRHLISAISICLLIIIIITFQDYGITWDENVQATYGEMVLKYFSSGFQDKSCNSFINLYLYPPLFEVFCALIYIIAALPKYETRHFMIALCMLFTGLAVYKIARLYSRPITAFCATSLLITFPAFYGHGFNNSKDVPFACAFSWAIYAILKLNTTQRKTLIDYIACGIVIGIALATRSGLALLLFYLIAGFFLHYISHSTNKIPDKINPFIGYILMFLVFWFLLVVPWPWMHQNPIYHPIEAFILGSIKFSVNLPVLFEGNIISSQHLPWYYLPKYIIITSPPIFIVFFIVGSVLMIKTISDNFRQEKSYYYVMILLWFYMPILYVMLMRPCIYDGLRHFLFIIPAYAIVCGLGAEFLFTKFYSTLQRKWLVPIFAFLLLLYPIYNLIKLHPYQSTYYNFIVGGLSKASVNYETDFWTTSYKEAAEWINERAKLNPDKKLSIVLAGNNFNRPCFEYYLRSEMHIYTFFFNKSNIPERFDYYVSTTRYGLNYYFSDLPVVHTISRDNAVFCVIKAQNQGK